MQIKTISYKRVNNLGSYSSEHLEMFAELGEGDDPILEAKNLKAIVENALGLKPKEPQPSDEDFKF